MSCTVKTVMNKESERLPRSDRGGLLMRTLWKRWSRPAETRGQTEEEREYYALNEGVYANLASAYDIAVWPLNKLRHEVVELSRAQADARVIDVATGTGAQARAFALKCHEVVGIDISEAMLRVARAKEPIFGLTYVQGDATDLQFDDASFDIASISFGLHEMPATVREAVLDEMVRVTKPHGTLVVVDYGLPQGFLGRHAVYSIIRFYEDAHYAEFVRLDVRGLLTRKGIDVSDDRSAFFGAARVLVGIKSAITSRTGDGPDSDGRSVRTAVGDFLVLSNNAECHR